MLSVLNLLGWVSSEGLRPCVAAYVKVLVAQIFYRIAFELSVVECAQQALMHLTILYITDLNNQMHFEDFPQPASPKLLPWLMDTQSSHYRGADGGLGAMIGGGAFGGGKKGGGGAVPTTLLFTTSDYSLTMFAVTNAISLAIAACWRPLGFGTKPTWIWYNSPWTNTSSRKKWGASSSPKQKVK